MMLRTGGELGRSGLVVVVLSLCAAACIDRTRVNTQCQWSPDVAGSLDLGDWPQLRHLYKDVELAEELAIRYADAVHKERYGYEGHGGLIENGRLRDECMASLMRSVAAAHDLPLATVEPARTRGYRDPRWDAGVVLSFATLYGWIAWLVVRAFARRFPIDDGWPALVAPALASLPVGVAALQLLALWGATLEAIRLGNGHVSSYR